MLISPLTALMQPTFLPWIGYFGLIQATDIFVFLDDFQFVRSSYHHRNRLFSQNAKNEWITLPVQHSGNQDLSLNETRPIIDQKFRRKFLKTIILNYQKTPYFNTIFPILESWIQKEWETLASMNISIIKTVSRLLNLETQFINSSSIPYSGVRSSKISTILNHIQAKTYLAAEGSLAYMREDGFFNENFSNVFFQNFKMNEYKQIQKKVFCPYLSIFDILFQIGPSKTNSFILKSNSFTYHENMS